MQRGQDAAGVTGRVWNLTPTTKGVETAWNKNTQVTCQRIHKTDISTDRSAFNPLWKMSGIAKKLQHDREKSHGIGTNSHAVKYLNQDFESLRQSCLERGRLFEDECFEALPSSLGFNELGPNSYKVRGITWKRPTVEWTVISAECAGLCRTSLSFTDNCCLRLEHVYIYYCCLFRGYLIYLKKRLNNNTAWNFLLYCSLSAKTSEVLAGISCSSSIPEIIQMKWNCGWIQHWTWRESDEKRNTVSWILTPCF